jgi:hypothetical protein
MMPRFPALVAALLLLATAPAFAAKKRPSLEPYAGSYTGLASADGLSSSATLTFTGRKGGLRGTFLYNGILDHSGLAEAVNQTVEIARSGILGGRVSIGGSEGVCSGKASMRGKALSFTLVYTLTSGETITLAGTVRFAAHRAMLTATVASTSGEYDGSLAVAGRR